MLYNNDTIVSNPTTTLPSADIALPSTILANQFNQALKTIELVEAVESIELVSSNQSPTTILQSNRELVQADHSYTNSYCKFSGILLERTSHFQNSFLRSKLVQSEHLVFSLSTSNLLKLASTHAYAKGTETEQSILFNAILRKSGIVHHKHALLLDSKAVTRLLPLIHAIVKQWQWYNASGNEFPKLPVYVVTKDNCDNIIQLLTAIRGSLTILKEYNQARLGNRINTKSKEVLELDSIASALDDTKEFSATLDSYTHYKNDSKYTKKLGKWAIKQLEAYTELEPATIKHIEYYILADSCKLTEATLLQYIKTLTTHLPMQECPDKCNLVLAYMRDKLECMDKALALYGFGELELLEVPIENDSRPLTTQLKQGVLKQKQMKIVPVSERTMDNIGAKIFGTDSPMARAMAKFKSTK